MRSFQPESNPRLEFHRHAAALVPETRDADPGLAVMVCSEKTGKASFTCNCRKYRNSRACPHIREVSGMITVAAVLEQDRMFRKSPWYRMAGACRYSSW